MGHYVIISKYRPNFSQSSCSINSILVWLPFPEIPIGLLNKDVLLWMANQSRMLLR